MRHLLMGVATIAMAASVTHANPGKGNGNGNAKAKSAASAPKSNGNRKAANGPAARGPAKAKNKQTAVRGNLNKGNGPNKANGPNKTNGNAARSNGPAAKRSDVRPAQAVRGNGNGNGNGNAKKNIGRADIRTHGGRDNDIGIVERVARGGGVVPALIGTRSLVEGCPPGLAKKRNGCQAPGQAKKNTNGYLPSFFGLGDRRSNDYFYNDGYLLRTGGSGVSAWLPLLGGALSIGSQWPGGYDSRTLPGYYENYYSLGNQNSYRYADQVVYRVDPETAAITSVAALLTGDDFAVGQPVPAGYDVYNVPRAYQDRYFDRPDRQYRYSDGYVYQVDPETRLVAAAIELVV